MRRLLPAPLLSAALLALWLTLNAPPDLWQVLLGATLAVLVPRLTASLRPIPVHTRRPVVALRLLAVVVQDMLTSNLQVGRIVLGMAGRGPQGAFVRVPLALRDPNGLAVLALITTVVPGTIWSELAADRTSVLVHVFDLDDEAAFVDHYKSCYEQPLREIFD